MPITFVFSIVRELRTVEARWPRTSTLLAPPTAPQHRSTSSDPSMLGLPIPALAPGPLRMFSRFCYVAIVVDFMLSCSLLLGQVFFNFV